MLNENLNNIHWKNQLENADGLTGELLPDKEAAWQKLHNRLHQKSHSKKVVWYWVAAALLLLTVAPYFLMQQDKTDLVKRIAPKEINSKSEAEKKEPVQEDAVVSTTSKPATKKKSLKNKTENNTNTIAIINKSSLAINKSIADSSTIVPVVTDSSLVSFATAQTKKKLKVVHINELGDPVEEALELTRTVELHSFQLKIANEEVFTANAFPLTKVRSAYIKIKLSPTN